MTTRRDLCVAALAVAVTWCGMRAATGDGAAPKPKLRSTTYSWDDITVQKTAVGEKRSVFLEPTATMDQLSCHITTVAAGKEPHAPHQHIEEELIIVKEGTLDVMQNGVRTRVGPGAIIFEASNELHGMRNVGTTDATYYVVKFWPPGMLAEAAKKSK